MERKYVDPVTMILIVLLLLAIALQLLEATKDKRVLLDDAATALFCSAEAMPVELGASAHQDSSAVPAQFSDLKPSHWAYDAVMELTSKNVIRGYPDGSFQPETPLLYSEFIKLILASRREMPRLASEEDVELSRIHWALGHYILALEKGYFTIHDITKQQLDRPIPRGVMALLISSVLQKESGGGDHFDRGENFDPRENFDSDEIRSAIRDVTAATPYEYEIVVSYAGGILNGYEDQTFRPAQGLTRAEGAAVIQRLMSIQKQGEGIAASSSSVSTGPGQDSSINRILSPEEVEKIVSLGPVTDYRIVTDPSPYDLSVRDSRYGGQKILSIRTAEPVCFLEGDPGTGQMKVLLEMTRGRSQYPSNTGLTARYFVGELSAVDYIAISPSYRFGMEQGTLTLVPNPFRGIKQ